MDEQTRFSRRTVLTVTGVSVPALLAGCLDDDDDDATDEVEDEDTDDGDDEVDDEETDGEDEDWEDVEEFYFEGHADGWIGIEPALIEGEENPTITLVEGQEYDFRWVNEDGLIHNLEIRDDDGDIVDDHQTDDVDEEGEEASLEGVEATEEMAQYICQYHPTDQVGDIEVEST